MGACRGARLKLAPADRLRRCGRLRRNRGLFDLDQGIVNRAQFSLLAMRATDFVVVKRPTLAKITKYPTIGFVNYECRLESMQSVMQSIQQAYLGTRERAVVVLEGVRSNWNLSLWLM